MDVKRSKTGATRMNPRVFKYCFPGPKSDVRYIGLRVSYACCYLDGHATVLIEVFASSTSVIDLKTKYFWYMLQLLVSSDFGSPYLIIA